VFTSSVYGESKGLEGKTLTLDECINIDLKTNPSSEISLQNLKAAQEKIGEAKGGYYPSFKLSSSYTYTTPLDSNMGAFPDNYDTRFSVKQTLYDAGATSNLIEGVRQSIKAREYDVKKTALDIILNIKSAFYEVLKRRDLFDVAKSSLLSAEKHLEQAKALYSEGLSPRSDVIKAEVQASNARLDVIKAGNAILLAKANLAAAIGLSVTMNFKVTAEGTISQTPLLPTLNETITHAYELRPEVKGIRAKIDSAQVNQIRETIRFNETQMSYANIYAPISGVIASVTTQQGETVSASSLNVPTFVTIVDLSRLEIYAYVDETDIGKIKPELEATFTVDSFPEKDFNGKVTAVYPKATTQDNVVYYITIISIENPVGAYNHTPLLKPDMTVNANIYLNKRDNVLAVPNKAIKREGGKKVVTVLENNKPVQKAIKTGWKDSGYTEVLEGLKEGDKVVTGEALKKEEGF